MSIQTITVHFTPAKAGTYQFIPFTVPPGTASLRVAYRYTSCEEVPDGAFTAVRQVNCVDLGLVAPDGMLAGASGSDKAECTVSEIYATPGYERRAVTPGEWNVLCGVYRVGERGVDVTYDIELTPKARLLYRGDLHAHTVASDGVLTAEELARLARANDLDFLAVTDHNQMAKGDALPQIEGITLIPGVEWTHYRGHANFLGCDRPYGAPFATNDESEMRRCFESGRARGAFISLNHPCDSGCPFTLDMGGLPFDALEVWNGPMREDNLKAVQLWHSMLTAGKRVPICGGSDYHRNTPFIFLGGPTTCVHALSAAPSDILDALRQGHSYIIFAPDGPALTLDGGETLPGETAPAGRALHVEVTGLLPGDTVLAMTPRGPEKLLETTEAGSYHAAYALGEPGFVWFQVTRRFLPGVPALPALMSNAVYIF